MSSKPSPQGSLVMLWAGENPALHWVLLERLQAAEIPFSDKTLGDDQVALTADPLPIDWKPRFGFEVAVLSPDLPAAREILEKLLDEDLEDVEIPAQDGAPVAQLPLVVTADKHPMVEVWSGNDNRIAQFLTAAMQENEIPIHLENPGEQTNIYVSAANEKRAREIVREIVEGVPPQ
jgi:hypothetical protein